MIQTLVQYLSRFIQLSEKEIEQLTKVLVPRNLEAKERLINIGGLENHIHFVTKGLLRKYFFRGKEEVVVQLAKENSIISSSVSFFNGKPSDYIVEAIEPSTIFSLHKNDLEQLYATDVKFERLGRLITLEWLLFKEATENERLQLSTKDRFLKFAQENEDFMKRVPQKYLASYLNIQPETFSRYKHLLKENNK